jgi:hypothetical protein
MRYLSLFLLLSTMSVMAARAEEDSALSALKALPEEDRFQLARIEGREGTPTPARWYFQVFAPDAQNGVREEVVEQRRLVARREVSQFTTELKPNDMVGGVAIHVDSDSVGNLARQYASANNFSIASLDYTLAKSAPDAIAVWTVRCMDTAGRAVGTVSVSAEDGTVLAHEGFPNPPSQSPPAFRIEKGVPREDAMENTSGFHPPADEPANDDGEPSEKTGQSAHRRHGSLEAPPPPPVREVIRSVHHLIRRLLPF